MRPSHGGRILWTRTITAPEGIKAGAASPGSATSSTDPTVAHYRSTPIRTYPIDSPQAAARIVALAMLADGQMCKAETDVLDRLYAHEELGLGPDELHRVVHLMCDDMLSTAEMTWADACKLDPRTLEKLTAEINDSELRLKVLGLCVAVIEAEGHVVEGEAAVLRAVAESWGLQRWMAQRNSLIAERRA